MSARLVKKVIWFIKMSHKQQRKKLISSPLNTATQKLKENSSRILAQSHGTNYGIILRNKLGNRAGVMLASVKSF